MPGTPASFPAVAAGIDTNHHLPAGYSGDVLIRWGDTLDGSADNDWDPRTMDAQTQANRFGYNNDFLAYLPLPAGSDNSVHGLLCANHEYTNTQFMWPGLNPLRLATDMDAARTDVELAAVGHSIVEIRYANGHWQVIPGTCNRRYTATSEIRLHGPAAAHPRMRTRDDPNGTTARGILNPCSGGKTPWGTILVAEENFNFYFQGRADAAREQRNHARYGVGSRRLYSWWARHHARFDIAVEPHEPNRFGWVVEIDPYDPTFVPRKRTALGRFKHEAATCVLNPDGRVVVYSGDDEGFEYLYRFVSAAKFDPLERRNNRDLLDHGELSVARFLDNGELHWNPLVYGRGPLTPANDFHNQGDVLIETRRAADLLGATRLDRPEDVETNPLDGVVYAILTGNAQRHADALDAANPRTHNRFGHILRLLPPGAPGPTVEHAADTMRWEIFVLAGNPANPQHHAAYPTGAGPDDWFASPDNCAFDPAGRLWIATDQGNNSRLTGSADGLWAALPDGVGGLSFKRFFRAPIGAEVCGPEFTPDGRHLFLAVQHPGVDGPLQTSYDNPATRWPDFVPGRPPRPSVMAIRRDDNGVIGGR